MTRTTFVATRTGAALAVVCVAALLGGLAARDAKASLGPLPILGASASASGAVAVVPAVEVVICHVAVRAEAVGIPVVVEARDAAALIAANPGDYVGTCRSGDGAAGGSGTTGAPVPGPTVVQAGALEGLGDGVLVTVCAPGDGQLSLTPGAAAALVGADSRVTFGSCPASRSTGSRGAAGSGTAGSGAASSGASLLGSRTSVSATSLSCDGRLILTRVATTPRVVRTANARVTARLVIVDHRGSLVRGARVWLRSTPLGLIRSAATATTAVDGSARLTLTTTKQLRLRPGARLVLFARATLPGRPVSGCVTGRRLISIRVGAPRS